MSKTPLVENELSSESNQAMRLATSIGCAGRPRIGVSISAGVTQFTRIPFAASSLPMDFVSPITPALAAEYAAAYGLPSLPAIEEMLTIRPQPALSMYGM